METEEIPNKVPAHWVPTQSIWIQAVLGKLTEEAGELISAASRCQIQGLEEKHPDTGKLNREWLQDEIADVLALVEIINQNITELDAEQVQERCQKKFESLSRWLDILARDERTQRTLGTVSEFLITHSPEGGGLNTWRGCLKRAIQGKAEAEDWELLREVEGAINRGWDGTTTFRQG